MAYFNNFLCILCLINLKELQTAKIYLIEVPNRIEETAADSVEDNSPFYNTSYSEYNILTEYEDHMNNYEHEHAQKIQDLSIQDKISMCHRAYGSKQKQLQCLRALTPNHNKIPIKNLKNKFPKDSLKIYKEKFQLKRDPIVNFHRIPINSPAPIRQRNNRNDFSQDYLDVKDLGREDFEEDYVDVTELRRRKEIVPDCKVVVDEFGQITTTNCIPSRKKANDGMKSETEETEESSESESDLDDSEGMDILRKKKRYKVVSQENSKSDKSSEESDNVFETNNDSGSSIQGSDSIEVTTPKPKKKKSKTKSKSLDDDKYVYLQGNKYYSNDDFRKLFENLRRGYRMSHFLPKRMHWDEDQYHHLGYFWFNGPKGKYMNYKD